MLRRVARALAMLGVLFVRWLMGDTMTNTPLMEVVRIALDELGCGHRYRIADADYVDEGWCAKLVRNTDNSEVTVCVNRPPRGQGLVAAVDLFKARMRQLMLAE